MQITTEILDQAITEVATELNLERIGKADSCRVGHASLNTSSKYYRSAPERLLLHAGYGRRSSIKKRIEFGAVKEYADLKKKLTKAISEINEWQVQRDIWQAEAREKRNDADSIRKERIAVLREVGADVINHDYDLSEVRGSTDRFTIKLSYEDMQKALKFLSENK